MKILRYKKKNKSLYEVELDNRLTLLLYEDTILKYNLLLTKEIKEEDLSTIKDYNLECEVYYKSIDILKSRIKSIYELKQLLLKKEYPEPLIDKTINKLIKQGYLNDRVYARSYINNQILTTSNGPYKIEKSLLDKKIDQSIIEEELNEFSEDIQISKINKIIEKKIKSNHTRGGSILKSKILNDLKNLGYPTTLTTKEINKYNFTNTSDIAKREYEKLYRKYSRKLSGKELDYKIKQSLYQKGLSYEEEN